MPELEFVLHTSDEMSLIEYAIDLDLRFVPDPDEYEERSYVELTTIDEYREWRQKTRRFFLLSDAYQTHPLLLGSVERNGRTVYYIQQREGGPYIDLLGSITRSSGHRFMSQGFVAHYATHWNEALQQHEPVGDSLRAIYRQLVLWIKKHSTAVKRESDGRVFRIGPHALQAWRDGYDINIGGLVIDGRSTSPTNSSPAVE